MTRVFVSHANADRASDAFLDDLLTRLDDAGVDVLIDVRRLQPGAQWRLEIYSWLSTCTAAIILLSPAAVAEDSTWVPRETSLLMWRQALDPNLTIIPVICGDVALDALETDARFRDLNIAELQAQDSASANAVTRIVEVLQAGAARVTTPLDGLLDFVTPLLDQVDAADIQQALALAPDTVTDTLYIADPVRRLAYVLMTCALDDLHPPLEHLFLRARSAAIADIAAIVSILGANWVNLEAAQWIARESAARMAGREARALALNASTLFAAEMYVQRASSRPPRMRWPLIPITGVAGLTALAEIKDEIDHALQTHLPLPPDPFQTDAQARRRRQLDMLARRGVPVFVLMQMPADPDAVINAVEEMYPQLNLFFLTDSPGGDAPAAPRVRRLLPPLDPEDEHHAQSMIDYYQTAYQF
ncbi:MAG: toll/interleukin-1 receptor domain-containing protein [Pseudomonadota bacterium]